MKFDRDAFLAGYTKGVLRAYLVAALILVAWLVWHQAV